MKVYKKIEIELTSEEKQILLKARDVIDTLIEKMFENNLTLVGTDFDTYDDRTLDAIASDLYSLSIWLPIVSSYLAIFWIRSYISFDLWHDKIAIRMSRRWLFPFPYGPISILARFPSKVSIP